MSRTGYVSKVLIRQGFLDVKRRLQLDGLLVVAAKLLAMCLSGVKGNGGVRTQQ
jgi:hypothetical protein